MSGLGSSSLEAQLGQITALVQARGLVARAFCQAFKPCFCNTHGQCHAELIYRREAELAVAALQAAGLIDFGLTKSIQDALGTAETGQGLIDVARAAHQAELEVNHLLRIGEADAWPPEKAD